jgi:hypothetical protein
MPVAWIANNNIEPENTEPYAYDNSSGSQEYNSSPDDSSSNAMQVSSESEVNESESYNQLHPPYPGQYDYDYSHYNNNQLVLNT